MELFALKVRQRYLSTFHTVRQRYLSTLHAVSGTYLAFTLSDSGTSLPSIRSDSSSYLPCMLSDSGTCLPYCETAVPIYLACFQGTYLPCMRWCKQAEKRETLVAPLIQAPGCEQQVCPLTVSDSPALGRGLETPFSISILELRSGTRHAHASSSADVGPAWRCG